jgi:hypothetical protein
MKSTILFSTVLLASTLYAASEAPVPSVQIAAAVLAAPEELRAGAAVLGYNAQGELVRLREGKNELICLANDPASTKFHVACYHKDLNPHGAAELLAAGNHGQHRNDVRAERSR